jgi:kynurenine formamidase
MKTLFLSYPLKTRLPVYGRIGAKLVLKPRKSLEAGDSCNVFWFGMENHWGTHVDAPAHFFKRGAAVADYASDVWHFRSPQLIKVRLRQGQLLSPEDLTESVRPAADLLLFKSGWYRRRAHPAYALKNPGIDPAFGAFLRKKHPSVRAVGFDWISLSSRLRREEGRKAHRVFLNPKGRGRPIFILEDMDLSGTTFSPSEVWVAPLRLQGMDSAPCTVIGVFK